MVLHSFQAFEFNHRVPGLYIQSQVSRKHSLYCVLLSHLLFILFLSGVQHLWFPSTHHSSSPLGPHQLPVALSSGLYQSSSFSASYCHLTFAASSCVKAPLSPASAAPHPGAALTWGVGVRVCRGEVLHKTASSPSLMGGGWKLGDDNSTLKINQ